MVLDHVLKLVIILSVIASVLAVLLAKPIMIAFANQKGDMSALAALAARVRMA